MIGWVVRSSAAAGEKKDGQTGLTSVLGLSVRPTDPLSGPSRRSPHHTHAHNWQSHAGRQIRGGDCLLDAQSPFRIAGFVVEN